MKIRKITPDERDQYNSTIALTFITDPIARFCYPDPAHYMNAMPKFSQGHGGSSIDHNTALVIGDFAGACSWIPPGHHINEEEMGATLEATVSPERIDRIWYFLEEFGKYEPEEPHWYLPMIGVDPRYTGQGLGTKMLEYSLDIIDKNSEVAFLGSSNPRNIPVYERCGFEVMGKIEITPEGIATPMIRPAQ